MALLEIQDLHASVDGHEILKGVNLTVNAGEVHSIMGPNGSGKSTLAAVLARRETYAVTGGRVLLDGKDLLEMKPEDAAREGVFLAFQYPVEIPGIGNAYFLRSALNAIRKHRGEDELDAMDFLPVYKEHMKLLEMDDKLMNRSVNEGFSGGEKKRNEILQMAVLQPKLAILDETDSGLDIDALRIVAQGVNAMRSPDRSFLVITHYQRLLDYIATDFVHVLVDGKIVRSGGPELALAYPSKVSSQLDITANLAGSLSSYYSSAKFKFLPSVPDVRAFQWDGWNASPAYTYLLDVTRDFRCDHAVRKHVRKCREGGAVLSLEWQFDWFRSLSQDTVRGGTPVRIGMKYQELEQIACRMRDAGLAWMATALTSDGQPLASRIAFRHSGLFRLPDWVAGSSSELLALGGNAWIMTQIAEEARRRSYSSWDLCGANYKNIAKFKSQFGGDLVHGWNLTGANSSRRAVVLGRVQNRCQGQAMVRSPGKGILNDNVLPSCLLIKPD